MRCNIFSYDYTPFDREMFSSSVDVGFILALPFYHEDLKPDCVEFRRGKGGEVGPSVEREAERCSQY